MGHSHLRRWLYQTGAIADSPVATVIFLHIQSCLVTISKVDNETLNVIFNVTAITPLKEQTHISLVPHRFHSFILRSK